MEKPLIILTGPTAVGKTELSVQLAKTVDCEIISADSVQVYKYMDIGSAKVTEKEMQGIKHYLIDELMPDEEFNIVRFKESASGYAEEIYAKGKIPLIVGGTGFYIQALLYDIAFTEHQANRRYREELEQIAFEKGTEYIHNMLREVDEPSALCIHPNNKKRIIRALEYYKETGKPISNHNEEQKRKDSPYQYAYFVLNDERERLYRRIDARVDHMIENGLVEEVKMLKERGYTKELVSMQGLGYKEILRFLDGELTLEEAVYILKRDTRHYAKRQLTWFRRERDIDLINHYDYGYDKKLVLDRMIQILKMNRII